MSRHVGIANRCMEGKKKTVQKNVDKLLLWQKDIISKHGLDIPLVNKNDEGSHATAVRMLFYCNVIIK